MTNRERSWCVGLIGGLILTAFCGCHRREVAPPPVAVQVATLKREPIVSETRFSATVRERHRVELSFKVPGTLAELLQVNGPDGAPHDVHEGDAVTSDAEPLRKAVVDSALVRLRPVLVTVLATVGGLIPLAIKGGPLWEPMCYVQIAGLLLTHGTRNRIPRSSTGG